MELLPNDIRQHTFSRGMRGYDRDEVEQFLEHVAEALEDALSGRREAEDKARRLNSEIARFRELEGSLKEAVVTAQKAMSQAQEASSQESESLKRAAQSEALQIVQDAESKRLKVESDIRFLEQMRENHVQQFRAFLSAQLATLEQMSSRSDAASDRKPTPVVKSKPLPEPVQPTWEAAIDSGHESKHDEDRPEPQLWQPERISRTEIEEHEEELRDKGEDAGEAVVAFPPPLRPGEDHRGE